MAVYVYREGCDWSDRFDAATDEAAEAHVMATYRSADNPDFDGDEAVLCLVETDEDGEFESGVTRFEGENMIGDPYGQRNPRGF